MSRAGKWRVGVAIGVGLAAGFVLLAGELAIRADAVKPTGIVIVLAFLLLLFGAPLAWLANRACSRSRELTIVDATLCAVLFFFALQTFMAYHLVRREAAQTVSGAECNGGEGRRVVTSHEANGPIYWACVPLETYREMQAAGRVGDEQAAAPARTLLDLLLTSHAPLRSLILGLIAGVTGWLFAFGRRWRVRTDEL